MRPNMKVKLVLSLTIQNKCLRELSTAFGITETHTVDHEILCNRHDFAVFMSLLGRMDKPPTIKQLRMEYVNVKDLPITTTVRHR